MAATAKRPDLSILKSPILLGNTGFLQLMQSYHVGTEEVKEALVHHCDFIMECKVCRSLFRGLPNFLAHKRHYCVDPDQNYELSLENVRIVQPSTSTLISQPSTEKEVKLDESQTNTSLLYQTLTAKLESPPIADGTSKRKQVFEIDGIIPVPCPDVFGLNSFIRFHKFCDKTGLICNLCPFTAHDISSMRFHIKTTHLKKVTIAQCKQCQKVYKDAERLRSHLVTEHNVPVSDIPKYLYGNANVERYIVNGKVYDIPPTEKALASSKGNFSEDNNRIMQAVFKCMGVLNFFDEFNWRSECIVHSQNLDGFQNVRRHMVEFHLNDYNICLFCSHKVMSLGHLIKHMVIAHQFSIEKVFAMQEQIRLQFGSREDWENRVVEVKPANASEEIRDTGNDEVNLLSEASEPDIKQEVIIKEENSPESIRKRKQHTEEELPKSKRQRVVAEVNEGIVPISTANTKSLRAFITEQEFILPNGHCIFCKSVTKHYKSQKKHLLTKHIKREDFYQCKDRKCCQIFKNEESFKNHVAVVHKVEVVDASAFLTIKFVLPGGKIYDIPERYKYEVIFEKNKPRPITPTSIILKRPDSPGMSSAVLYSEREMMLAVIACLYTVKFHITTDQVAQCMHHPDVTLQNFTSIVEHLISHHIKEDYGCTMCPFRRKDALALVKHLSSSHHLSVERIQRMKERIRASFKPTEVASRGRMNIASMSLRSIEQIVEMLSSRDRAESVADDESRASTPTPDSVSSPKFYSARLTASLTSTKELLLGLMNCLGILRFQSAPEEYTSDDDYCAECKEHPEIEMRGIDEILQHLVDYHLKVSNNCALCGYHGQTLELLAKHLGKVHGLSRENIMEMKEALRFTLLRKAGIVDQKTSLQRMIKNKGKSVLNCPEKKCQKTFTTFKKMKVHCVTHHRMSEKMARKVILRIRMEMNRDVRLQKAEVKKSGKTSERLKTSATKTVHSDNQVIVKTKSGRIVGKGISKKPVVFMFGLEDWKCKKCSRPYPTFSKVVSHLRCHHNLHLEDLKLYEKYVLRPQNQQTDMDEPLAPVPQTLFESGLSELERILTSETKPRHDDSSVHSVVSDLSTRVKVDKDQEIDSDDSGDETSKCSNDTEIGARWNRTERRSRRSLMSSPGCDQPSISLFGIDDLPCLICMKSFPTRSHLKCHTLSAHNLDNKQANIMIQKLKNNRKSRSVSTPEEDSSVGIVKSRRKQGSPRKAESKGKSPVRNISESPEEKQPLGVTTVLARSVSDTNLTRADTDSKSPIRKRLVCCLVCSKFFGTTGDAHNEVCGKKCLEEMSKHAEQQ